MPKFYHGWYLVGMTMLIYMLVLGTTFNAFGLFVLPVSAEFGLSRADTNTAIIILNIGSAALAPFVGRMLDQVPARRIMIGGALLFGTSFAILGLSHSVLLSAIVLALPLAAATLAAGTLTNTVLLVRWFVIFRGRAIAIAVMGVSLGGVLVTPLVGLLIEAVGWRNALLVIGGIVTALLLLISLGIRERPRADEGESDTGTVPTRGSIPSATPAQQPLTMASVLAMPQFWMLGLGAAMAMAMPQGIIVSLVPIALELKLSMLQATSLISAASAAAIVGKLLLVVVADRVDRTVLLAAAAGLGVFPSAGLLVSQSYPLLLACAAFVGFISGILAPVLYALVADRFGTAAFGTVRGLMAPIVALVGAVAVRFSGEVYDRTGNYDLVFAAFIGTAIVASLLLFSVRFTHGLEATAPYPEPPSKV